MRARFIDGFWQGLIVASAVATVAMLFVKPVHAAEALPARAAQTVVATAR
jgi:hypothetical protein